MRANHRIFPQKKMMGDGTHSIPHQGVMTVLISSSFLQTVDQFVFYAPQKNRTTTWAAKMRRNIDNG